VVDEAVVQEGNIITSTAPATAIDVALHLLAQVADAKTAAEISRLMGFPPFKE
jgi:4-methyl-5(b-hydroxyethyl)-thiazole monophosphate biosynthesis